jgi:PKD repeat protein
MTTPITYAQAKAALVKENYPTSPSPIVWAGTDVAAYDQFGASLCYNSGVPFKRNAALYGFAYVSEMPAPIVDEISSDNYSVTIVASPLSGTEPLSVTATATEVGGSASNFNWNWGDGTTNSNTSSPTATHSYTIPGSYVVKMTPTVDTIIGTQVSAGAPVVVSAPAYSLTMAGTPLTGAHPLEVTWTVTEHNGTATQFQFNPGDGTSTQVSTNPFVYTYTAAGTYTASVVATEGGVAKPSVNATAPAVVS